MERKALTFTEEEITAFHEEMLYPVVRIQAKSALGSGSIIYSKPKQNAPSEYETYILTNHHVIDSAITQVEKWSSLLQRKYKGDVFADVDVEIFEYQYESWEPTHHTIPGEIVTYDQDQDLGLVRLKTVKPMKYVAKMLPKGESKNKLRMFMTTLTVGSGLGEEPFPSIPGMLASLNRRIANTDGKGYTFHLSSSPSIYGNCLVGDSLVSMSDNTVKPIKEVKIGDSVWSCSKNGVKSGNRVEEIIESGEKDIYELKTRTRTLKASGNHPILRLTKRPVWYSDTARSSEFRFAWVKVEDLIDGDIIAVLDQLPERFKSKFNFNETFGQASVERDGFREKFMRLLGFMIGDSYVRIREGTSYEIALYPYNKELAEKYREILEFISGGTVAPSSDHNEIRMYNKKFAEILASMGLDKKSHEISIPIWVFTLPPELQLAFIEGYLDSDGYINPQGSWVFEAVSEKLIRQLRMLCIHLGMNISNIYHRDNSNREVTINNRKVKKARDSYSFQCYPNYQKNKNTFIEGFDNSNIPLGLHLERVRKVKSIGKEMTYDIKLANTHNFFADGVLVHNSGGACFLMATHEMIGIPSRIAVTGRLGSDAITHMGYIIPIERVYRFFKTELLYFLYDSNYTTDQCFDLRQQKREEDEKRMAIDISRNGDADTGNN